MKFPNETEEYRQARNTLLQAETELRAKVEQVAALRRELPLGGKVEQNYAFKTLENQTVTLSELFQSDKNSLLVYSYMFGPDDKSPCPACTSLLDGLDGSAPHIMQAANFAVVISGDTEQAKQIKLARGWRSLNLLSCAGNDYNRHYHGESANGGQMPMLNVFTKKDNDIYHFWGTELLYAPSEGHPRHMDQLWPVWNALDLTPEGRSNDIPKLNYDE